MKRLFVLLIVLITIVCSLSAADSDYSFPFTLVLNRNGTDSVWFTRSVTDKETDKISLHIFPIISAADPTTSSVTSTVYLHWLKQSSNKVNIKITFVGNESHDETKSTFMMWCASIEDKGSTTTTESEDNGINFDVEIKDANNKPIGSLTFNTAADRLTKKSDAERSISFDPAATTTTTTTDGSTDFTYKSPLSIVMTINPASWDTDTTSGTKTAVARWGVDIQFVGYIKATIVAQT